MIERIEADKISQDPSWPMHMARYQFALPFVRGKRVLDAGTGIGYGAALMSVEGCAKYVMGVDISTQAINQARKLFGTLKIDYRVHDCHRLSELGGPYDVITSFENIEHLKDPEVFLGAAAGLLSDDGCLLISTPDRSFSPPFVSGRPTNPYHVTEWYADEFEAILHRHFENVDFRCQVQGYAIGQWKNNQHILNDNLAGLEQIGRYSGLMRMRGWLKGLVLWMGKGHERKIPYVEKVCLAIPRMEDYPIVERSLASLYGHSMCHVAVCREPKK